jgi:hypothetical protein
VAKNWARFDSFLDILYTFGCGPESENNSSATKLTESGAEITIYPSDEKVEDILGLEYLMSV